jgi:hypothetical protein
MPTSTRTPMTPTAQSVSSLGLVLLLVILLLLTGGSGVL